MTESEPMILDDAVEPTDNIPAKDNDGVPYCRKHHCRMKQSSGGKKSSATVYYSCPVSECDEKAQMIKTPRESVVPPQPLTCPRCKPDTVCERDSKSSTASSVVLKCPCCGWKSNALVVPQLAAAHLARRPMPPIENIGDR